MELCGISVIREENKVNVPKFLDSNREIENELLDAAGGSEDLWF